MSSEFVLFKGLNRDHSLCCQLRMNSSV